MMLSLVSGSYRNSLVLDEDQIRYLCQTLTQFLDTDETVSRPA